MTAVDDILREAYAAAERRVLEREGWWCPRCDVMALPLDEDGPGWCPFCGLDPLVEGPNPPPKPLVGILGLMR